MSDNERQDPPPTGQPIISEPGFTGRRNLLQKANNNNNSKNSKNNQL